MNALRLLAALCFALMATTAKAEEWPMPVDKFLSGDYLEHGDIVLTRREWSATSMFIRWTTDALFSHTGMVFASPSEPGYGNTYIIEAIATGIDITSLKSYIKERGTTIGIKRLRRDWYSPKVRSRVRGILLDKIKADYAYGTVIKVGKEILFDVQRHWSGFKEAVASFRSRDWKPPNEFICSGLVQVGLVEAVSEFILRRELPPWALNEVVFDPKIKALLPTKEAWQQAPDSLIEEVVPEFRKVVGVGLEATTPAHIAENESFEWLYIISNGKVYRISNESEAKMLMGTE